MLTVYGADWCEDTQRSLRLLRRLGVAHRYRNVDEEPDALARAKELNGGKRRTPTIQLDDEVLVEPRNDALSGALVRHGQISADTLQERLAAQNVGDLERVLRTGGGLLALAMASQSPPALRWPLRLMGVMNLVTGLTGWCPAYAVAGVSSLGGPGDRPLEAERREWTTPLLQGDGAGVEAVRATPGPGLEERS